MNIPSTLHLQSTTTSSDFANDDGSRRLLELAEELEDVFPTHDLSGQRVTAVHSHYRMLTAGCPTKFAKPKCEGSCTSCKGKVAKAKCKARKLKCKASSIKGISFPFSKCHVLMY